MKKLWLSGAMAVCLLAGCSKSAPSEAVTPKLVSLGTVDFTSDQPLRHDIGDGRVCVIKVSALNATTLEVIATVEKSGKELAATRVVPAAPDAPLDLNFGGIDLQFTPHIK